MNYLEAIRIHLRLGLLIVFIIPTLAWLQALTITPIFESRARLLIEVKDLGLEGRIDQFRTVARQSDPIQTQIQILKSATILEQVIRKFNLRHKGGPNRGQYLSYLNLSGNLGITSDRNADIVELKYKDPSPKVANQILQALIDSYIEKTIELKASDTASAIRFLKKERNKAEREALEASKRLREFEQRSKNLGIDTIREYIRASFDLEGRKLAAESEYAKARVVTQQYATRLMTELNDAILTLTINEDPFLSSIRKDLYEKESQLIKLQTKVKPGHYQLEELKEQIQGGRKLIENRIKDIIGGKADPKNIKLSTNPIESELTRGLIASKSTELAIKEQLGIINDAYEKIQKKIEQLPNEKYIYSQLLRSNEVTEKRLEEIENKLIDSRMKGVIASHVTNIRVIDPPSFSFHPISPNIPQILMSAFIFGLCLAAIAIYLVEYFDDVIKSVDTLPKEMGCPFLGQLPYAHMSDLPVVYQEPKSDYTEAIHALRTNISFLALSGNRKLLLVTSPSMSEGKSTVSVNLGITYAQGGKRVLLVDADIRNPSLHKYLARPKDPIGISNTLIDEIDFYDVVQKSILGIVGFDFLPGGEVPPNPIQLLESDKMRELLETAEHIYDLVILDTPPIGLFSDALLLARYADIVTIVTRNNKTSRKELISSIDLLNKTNVKAIGVILNAVQSAGHGPYSYGYGYGYSYGYSNRSERYSHGESAA